MMRVAVDLVEELEELGVVQLTAVKAPRQLEAEDVEETLQDAEWVPLMHGIVVMPASQCVVKQQPTGAHEGLGAHTC